MADEKQDLTPPLKGSRFGLLPRELFLVLSNYFSLPELGRLRLVSKFFVQLFYEIAFFQERGKAWVLEIFYRPYRLLHQYSPEEDRKEQFTKEFLRSQIDNSPQKIDLSEARLSEINDYSGFPEKNIILKKVAGTKFSDFYSAPLFNKILFKILDAKGVSLRHYEEYTYDYIEEECNIYRQNGINVSTNTGDFFEHCILYRFNMLPSKVEAKNTLKCFFSYRKLAFYQFQIGMGCADPETITAMKESMSLVFPRGLSSFDSDAFRELQENYGKENHFTIWINIRYAIKLFLTNPIHIALHLLNTPEYFAEEDFQKSCEILLTEIEKFRGFSNLGVTDKGLNKLKEKLKGAILLKRCFTETSFKMPANDSEDSYSYVNRIFNNMPKEIGNTLNADSKNNFQNDCKEIQTYTAKVAIEQEFKKHFDNKAECQKAFKKIMNSSGLGVAERAKIFNHFKDRIELNRHRNPRLDDFFGIKNTTSWRETWKEIRDNAKQKLFDEVDALPEIEKKQALLNWATNNQTLFCDHRNNTVLKGAFGRTQAVRDIEKCSLTLTLSQK